MSDLEVSLAKGEALFQRGVLYEGKGWLRKALAAFDEACALLPARADFAFRYACALDQARRFDEAKIVFLRALSLAPQERAYLFAYGNFLCRRGELAEGEAVFRRLVAVYPNDGQGLANWGVTLGALGLDREAEEVAARLIDLAPPAQKAQARYGRAMLLLSQKKWDEGFAAYKARLDLPGAVAAPWGLAPMRPDLPKGSRVLLWNDQGQGDALMFLRFAPALAAKGFCVFAFVQPGVKSLAACAPGIKAAFSPLDAPQDMDAAAPLCSLPHLLGFEEDKVWPGPYIKAPTPSVYSFGEKKGARVGLVWAGNPDHPNDTHRSMRLADFAPLFEVQGIEWFSLQCGAGGQELAASPWRDKVTDLAPLLTDFAASASVLAELDLLLTVDTAPAHLAGAMGLPVWTFLPIFGNDWRWGNTGDTSLWYPSMRLFRQKTPGVWADPVFMVRDLLPSRS